jgi:hypothetical protein
MVKRIRPSPWALRKLGMVGFMAGVAALAFFWGRNGSPLATAQQPGSGRPEQLLSGAGGSDYQRRVVAYIYGNVPITREDLGEYLIARFGADRLEFLVNRRIIDMACQARGITVSDAEVDAQLKEDIASFGGNITEKDFVNVILKRYNKSLYEWREDVIRPKLALSKFCRHQITVTDDDIQKAFEAHYGEKVECRMIVLQKQTGRENAEIWARVSKSEEEFNKLAGSQFIPQLAAQGGKIPPIYKHFGDPEVEKAGYEMEKAAFALTTPGQVSQLIGMPDGTSVILKLVQRIPPDTTVRLNDERPKLHKEMFEYKLSQAIPVVFKELRTKASPTLLLRRETSPPVSERHVQEPGKAFPGTPVPAPGGLRGQ